MVRPEESATAQHSSATTVTPRDVAALGATHLRAIFDHSQEAILLVSSQGEIIAVNDAAGRLFLCDPSALVGRMSHSLLDQSDERRLAAGATVQRTGIISGMLTLRRQDGAPFEAELTATTFRDADEIEQGYVFVRDVTERRNAELALLASEHRYRSLVETTGSVLVGIAPDGMVFEWNREAERLFGYARQEVLGRDYFSLMGDAARREAMRHEVIRVLAGDTPRPREDALVSRTGDARTVLWTATRLLDMHGKPLGVIASGQDITERKRLEAQMQHAQKLESLGVLAGGIAHDFNNLLVGILGNASLGLMDVEPNSELHELLRDIETAALRAADLTRQMLAYSGRGRFLVKPLDLSATVQEMAHLLQSAISKRAALQFDFGHDVPPVEADGTQLRQVVMNLITNASDALAGENGTIALRTGVRWCDRESLESPYLDYELEEGVYAFVEVRDSGIGMTPETMERIFDPFFSTKFAGRGLGLAATLGIVRGHRGTITVESAPGEGTAFRVFLPVAPPPASRSDAVERLSITPPQGSGLALLVDDDHTVCDVARAMLERHGYEVRVAHDGVEALDAYRRVRDAVRLAVVDLTMPRMGGEDLVAAIRALDSDLPIVLMSGFSESEICGRFQPGFVTACIQKPFRVEELSSVLRAAAEGGALQG